MTDRDRLTELARVWTYGGHVAHSAATVALVAPATPPGHERDAVQYDLGQATMSMMIAAADLGIGTGHSAVGDHDLARELLGYPADRECAYLIAFGHPADRPLRPIAKPSRRPFDEVIHRDRW